jgi:hypothetical protein
MISSRIIFSAITHKAAQCNVVTFNLGVSYGDKAPTEDPTAWEGGRGGDTAEYWNCCGFLWIGFRPPRRQYSAFLLWDLGVILLIIINKPRLLYHMGSQPFIHIVE